MKTSKENSKQTMKELQEVAKQNGFYLCPEKVWNEMAKMFEYKDSEIKRLKKSRDDWKAKHKQALDY